VAESLTVVCPRKESSISFETAQALLASKYMGRRRGYTPIDFVKIPEPKVEGLCWKVIISHNWFVFCFAS
jgi:hypothetical protein